MVFHLTGVNLNHKDITIDEDPQYNEIMGELQNILCKRVVKIENELEQEGLKLNESVLERVDNRKRRQ